MSTYQVLKWDDGVLTLLDQRLIPQELVYLHYEAAAGVASAIRDMVIRGAPAIGVAAAYGLALAAWHSKSDDPAHFLDELRAAGQVLCASRPTAVNLTWAVERVLNHLEGLVGVSVERLRSAALQEAQAIAHENAQMNLQMGLNALPLVPDKANIIHHCNTGPLATVNYGTALGVVITAHQHGKHIHVYVDETRPRLQGARLTSWELQQHGIPHTVVVDSASGYLMRNVGIDLCLVGCDRIAANGDTANKIGTYNLALIAHAHSVPFYVVGPLSTIDMSIESGDEIIIEQRPADEVTHVGDCQVTPDGVDVANPAFDVTPARYITAIITDRGVVYPPFKESLARLLQPSG